MRTWMQRGAIVLLAGGVVACAPKPAPPPPPPPPPVVIQIPPRPTPPNSAAPTSIIPVRGLDGRFMTPNINLTGDRAFWHMRIALNVAAIGCRGPFETTLIANYNQIVRGHAATIRRSERAVIADLGKQTGTNGIAARDSLSTGLFNYFAQPPAQRPFCLVANDVAALVAATPAKDVVAAAEANLPRLEQPFQDFYGSFAKWKVDVAAWDAQYGATHGVPSAYAGTPVPTAAAPATTMPAATVPATPAAPSTIPGYTPSTPTPVKPPVQGPSPGR